MDSDLVVISAVWAAAGAARSASAMTIRLQVATTTTPAEAAGDVADGARGGVPLLDSPAGAA